MDTWQEAGGGVLGLGQTEETGEMEKVDETEEDEGLGMWGGLREELQERIMARQDFAKVFQTPVLSKSWKATFRSAPFRDEVTRVSNRWPTYCPVNLCRQRLVGYNPAAERWEKLFPLSFLPYVPQGDEGWSSCSGTGSLICFARRNKEKDRELFRINLRTAPISQMVYSKLVRAEEFQRSRDARRLAGPPRANWLTSAGGDRANQPGPVPIRQVPVIQRPANRPRLPDWDPHSEGFNVRFQDFCRRMGEFCQAEKVDEKLSPETKDCHEYISLCLGRGYPENLGVGAAYDMYVANLVTREWRELPCRPNMNRPQIVQLVAVGTSSYKVVLMTLRPDGSSGPFLIQIYDPNSESWEVRSTTKNICSFQINIAKTHVYLDSLGALFVLVLGADANGILYEILAYNVEGDRWRTIPHPAEVNNRRYLICGLVVCGSDVMLVTGGASNVDPQMVALGYTGIIRLLVYRLETGVMSFLFFSRGPARGDVGNVYDVDLVVGAGNCIYLGLRGEPAKPFLMFNIREKVWSTLAPPNKAWVAAWAKTTGFPFQPGLNPFAAVVRPVQPASAPDVGESAGDEGECSRYAKRPFTALEDVD